MPNNRLEEHWAAVTDHRSNSPWLDDGELGDGGASSSNAWRERIEDLLASHPAATVIAAVALGLTLGWLGKRK